MPAGDNPFFVNNGIVSWQKETTFGVAPASGAWNPFGYRVTDLRDPGPQNEWNLQRGWGGGREGLYLDLVKQDYGGPLATFKLTDPKVPGFAWGQEPNLPVAQGGGYYLHTAQPTKNSVAPSMSVQIHDQDGGAVGVTRTTYMGGVMPEVELSGDEAGELFFTPTMVFQDDDNGALAQNTVADPTLASYKHFHGAITLFGSQVMRILSWKFRPTSNFTRGRYWNSTSPKKSSVSVNGFWQEAVAGNWYDDGTPARAKGLCRIRLGDQADLSANPPVTTKPLYVYGFVKQVTFQPPSPGAKDAGVMNFRLVFQRASVTSSG